VQPPSLWARRAWHQPPRKPVTPLQAFQSAASTQAGVGVAEPLDDPHCVDALPVDVAHGGAPAFCVTRERVL
jgi:hypothetical protein